jgi:hypothetical protein
LKNLELNSLGTAGAFGDRKFWLTDLGERRLVFEFNEPKPL